MITVDTTYAQQWITKEEYKAQLPFAKTALKMLLEKQGLGNEFTGWLDFVCQSDRLELNKMKEVVQQIRHHSDILVVTGIGGSYLGARAVYEALKPYFLTQNKMQIIFAGHTLSSDYQQQLLSYLKDKSFTVNMISKSGTTTEPAIAFRMLKNLLIEQHGAPGYKDHIVVTTDKEKGALHDFAVKESITRFTVPSDIGGRYSVMTAVGLFPLLSAGIDVESLIDGAKSFIQTVSQDMTPDHPLLAYVLHRKLLYEKGKWVELLVAYEPNLNYLGEWWKQLFGESEGKNGKGIFPTSAIYSTDLHSLGQYLQDGRRSIFETVLWIEKKDQSVTIENDPKNLDQLNYLTGKSMHAINQKALQGTVMAHEQGGVPNIIITISKQDAYHIGELLTFFMYACGLSGYLLGVNPFDQPGVEFYKKNMFHLLGKPGYEKI